MCKSLIDQTPESRCRASGQSSQPRYMGFTSSRVCGLPFVLRKQFNRSIKTRDSVFCKMTILTLLMEYIGERKTVDTPTVSASVTFGEHDFDCIVIRYF